MSANYDSRSAYCNYGLACECSAMQQFKASAEGFPVVEPKTAITFMVALSLSEFLTLDLVVKQKTVAAIFYCSRQLSSRGFECFDERRGSNGG